jgi:hypothetical protein
MTAGRPFRAGNLQFPGQARLIDLAQAIRRPDHAAHLDVSPERTRSPAPNRQSPSLLPPFALVPILAGSPFMLAMSLLGLFTPALVYPSPGGIARFRPNDAANLVLAARRSSNRAAMPT